MPLLSKPESNSNSSSGDGKACRKKALDLLARREHSRLELRRKLSARAYSRNIIDGVLDDLEVDGLLEEARFVESFIRTRIGKGQGPTRIQAGLMQRGVAEASIQTGLLEVQQDWGTLASDVRCKRFGATEPQEFSERARQMRFLQYRGFERDQIDVALDIAADSD